MKKRIGIEGMSCDHCVRRVTEALKGMPGVKAVDVRLAEKAAFVEADSIDETAIKAAVDDAGYDVVAIE